MSQDPAGRPYLWAFGLFSLAVAATVLLYLFRHRLPLSRPLLIAGASIVALGIAFLLYLAVLMLRAPSKAEYDAYLQGLRDDARRRGED